MSYFAKRKTANVLDAGPEKKKGIEDRAGGGEEREYRGREKIQL